MKSWKKTLAVVCVGAMTLALAGCGADNSKKVSDGGKVKIEYWHVASESFGGLSNSCSTRRRTTGCTTAWTRSTWTRTTAGS